MARVVNVLQERCGGILGELCTAGSCSSSIVMVWTELRQMLGVGSGVRAGAGAGAGVMALVLGVWIHNINRTIVAAAVRTTGACQSTPKLRW